MGEMRGYSASEIMTEAVLGGKLGYASDTPLGLHSEKDPLKDGFASYCFIWWPGTESNCRHGDFQSPALPTELPGLKNRLYLNCLVAIKTI